MKEKMIILSAGLRAEILKRYGCTYATLKAALEYKTETALSRELRRYALERGSRVWVPVDDPDDTLEPGDQKVIPGVAAN